MDLILNYFSDGMGLAFSMHQAGINMIRPQWIAPWFAARFGLELPGI